MKKIFFLAVLFFGWYLIVPVKPGYAQETVKRFNSSLNIHQNGSISVRETIEYDFGSQERHGILRVIPLTAKVGELYLTSSIDVGDILRDNLSEKFTENNDSGKLNIKIGDADKTISGPHEYKVEYQVSNQIRNYEDHDELFWNVTGNDTASVIQISEAHLSLDSPVPITGVKCFTGVEGSKDQDCTARIDKETAIFSANAELLPKEGLTIVASFPANTFPRSVYSKEAPGSLNIAQKVLIAAVAVLYYLFLPVTILYWYLTNKRKNRFGPISVNFDIPKDSDALRIPPAEAGAIDNAKLEKDDVIATIFDLAIRKFIKVEQLDEKKVLGFIPLGGKDYKLIKLKDFTDSKKTEYEEELWDKMFGSSSEVVISSFKSDFYLTFQKMEQSLFRSLKGRGYYTKNPKSQQTLLLISGIFSLVSLNLLLGVLLIYLSTKLNGRTSEGDKKDWEIDGLKLFLKNMKRHYKWQAENLYTVEKYIPYAIALGYIDEFMEQLKIIDPDYKPSWYTGHGNFYSSYPAFYSGMSSNVSTVSPSSSSSGFSSGGSSGGGGGGGGVSSW